MTAEHPTLEFHPLANLFPLLEGDEFAALVQDVRENGLRLPIIVYDGLILDGRNRYRACLEANVPPTIEMLPADADPAKIVRSLNLNRRHLTTDQRAAIAAELVPAFAEAARRRQLSGRPVTSAEKGTAAEQAGRELHVSDSSVKRALQRKRADPAAHEQAKRGETVRRRPTPAPAERFAEMERALAEVNAVGAPLPPLSMTAQQKLEARLRKLEADFDYQVQVAAHRKLVEVHFPDYEKKLVDLKKMLLDPSYAVMRKDEYNSIMRCLHPDSLNSRTPEQLDLAFRTFTKYKLKLIDDEAERKEALRKLHVAPLPATREEMLARRNQPKPKVDKATGSATPADAKPAGGTSTAPASAVAPEPAQAPQEGTLEPEAATPPTSAPAKPKRRRQSVSSLAVHLTTCLDDHGMTVAQFAELAGLTPAMIQNTLDGIEPPQDAAEKMDAALAKLDIGP